MIWPEKPVLNNIIPFHWYLGVPPCFQSDIFLNHLGLSRASTSKIWRQNTDKSDAFDSNFHSPKVNCSMLFPFLASVLAKNGPKYA